MNTEPTIEFSDHPPSSNFDLDFLEFYVRVNGKPIKCLITHDAMTPLAMGNEAEPETFVRCRDVIQRAIVGIISRRQADDTSDIFIKSDCVPW